AASWDGIGIVRSWTLNEIGGKSFRTGIFLHPPMRMTLPSDIKIHKLEGELAITAAGWIGETDGAGFFMATPKGRSLCFTRIDPAIQIDQRTWNSISCTATQPENIRFITDPGRDNRYDWLVLSVKEAQ